MGVPELEGAARARHQVKVFPGATLEEQLLNARQAAKTAIFATVPASAALNADEAVLANERLRAQIEQNADVLRTYVEAGVDIDDAYGLVLSPEQLRQYVLARYSLACEGIGAYFSGYGQESVGKGLMTQTDYDEGLTARMETFSDIVRWHEDGHLGGMLNGEATTQKITTQRVVSSATLKDQTGTALILGSKGARARAITSPASGLGYAPPPVVAVIIVICAIVLVVGVVAYMVKSKQLETSARMMADRCKEADKYGYKETIDWCNKSIGEFKDSEGALDPFLGKGGTQQVAKYLLIGGAIYLGITFLPQIVASFGRATDVYEERKTRKLLKATNA
jgi:hypothetical protein